jgi:hypothetical protein
MRAIWNITIDDYLTVVELAKANGKKAGDSIEEEFFAYMKEKNKKPESHTELTDEELLLLYAEKGKKALNIKTENGQTKFYTTESKEDKND